MTYRSILVCVCLGAVSMWGCAEPADKPVSAPGEQILDVRVTQVDETVVAGGALQFIVEDAGAIVPAGAKIILDGTLSGQPVQGELNAEFLELPNALRVEVGWEKLQLLFGIEGDAEYQGFIKVEVLDLGGGLKGVGEIPAFVAFKQSLTPAVDFPDIIEIFANDVTTFQGDGILRLGEGTTDLLVDGTFQSSDNGPPELIAATVPVAVGASRSEAVINWPVVIFGIRPGTFNGTIKPINNHAQSGRTDGESVTVQIQLLPTEIDGFDPPGASRGQVMRALGRGFIPADAQLGQSMFFLLDGMFQTRSGQTIDFSGANAVQVAPEIVPAHTEAQLVLRSDVEDRGGRLALVGITAAPGTFQGTVTPVLIDGVTTIMGRPFNGDLTIAPTRQYVFVRFLPNFLDALDSFGLRNVEPEIRARILEVLARDYAPYNIEFSDIRPVDFVEYSVIEVGGPDPNGAGLFGLDNSAGKDTGNIRLNDVVGSQNAESGELGFYVFGGVFIESFRTFSPSLDPSSEVASPAFDEAFGPFMPALGGVGIDATEWPEGPRTALIEHAIHVLGSVVGNTITHEIGHSLGMSFFEQDLFRESTQFHNNFDEPGAIMDSGQNRPFEERAEIEGAAPSRFNERNTAYLEMILPLP